jgi:hypothetical protein
MKKILFSVILIFLSLYIKSHSQEIDTFIGNNFESKIGITAGYHHILVDGISQTFVDDPLCPFFEDAKGEGYYFGILYDLFLTENNSLGLSLNYEYLPFKFSTPGDIYPALVDDPNNPGRFTTELSQTQHSLDINYSLLTLGLNYKLYLFNHFINFSLGPTLGYVIDKNLKQKYSIIQPENVQFQQSPDAIARGYRYENNNRTIVVFDNDIPRVHNYRLGVRTGIESEVSFWGFTISAGVYYNHAYTKVSKDYQWFLNYFQAGISILYSI